LRPELHGGVVPSKKLLAGCGLDDDPREGRYLGKEFESGFEAKGIFLDNRVDEDLASNAVYFGFCRGFGLGVAALCWRFEGQHEVLSLAYVTDAAIVHTAECVGHSLALGVEYSALQRNINVGFH
jgi:hypothetical protein